MQQSTAVRLPPPSHRRRWSAVTPSAWLAPSTSTLTQTWHAGRNFLTWVTRTLPLGPSILIPSNHLRLAAVTSLPSSNRNMASGRKQRGNALTGSVSGEFLVSPHGEHELERPVGMDRPPLITAFFTPGLANTWPRSTSLSQTFFWSLLSPSSSCKSSCASPAPACGKASSTSRTPTFVGSAVSAYAAARNIGLLASVNCVRFSPSAEFASARVATTGAAALAARASSNALLSLALKPPGRPMSFKSFACRPSSFGKSSKPFCQNLLYNVSGISAA
mmetsp:Transcript_55504/g.148677  ORF Transcript_55504/g.148677 Transcript_55504/m.148677 type:complete len:276 (+) Transcript_55504:853-1680(+)